MHGSVGRKRRAIDRWVVSRVGRAGRLPAAALLAMVALVPQQAEACPACSRSLAAVHSRLASVEATPVVLDQELVEYDCDRPARQTRCRFVATYVVRNPTDSQQTLVAAFHVRRTVGVAASIDGQRIAPQPLELDATSGELQARLIDARMPPRLPPEWQLRRFGVTAAFEPSQTRRIAVSGTVVLTRVAVHVDPWALEPIAARHRMLGHDPAADGEYYDDGDYLVYLMYPKGAWSKVGRTEMLVRYPDRCDLTGGLVDQSWRSAGDDGTVATARVETTGRELEYLRLQLTFPRGRAYHGGPVVALGGDVVGDPGFRMRVGYELSGPTWLVYSLSAESDFDRRLVVTPVVEAATRTAAFSFVPSFSGGVGVPVRVVPEATVGIRGQVGLQFPAFGLVTALDLYPASWSDEDPDRIDLTLMGRVSL